MTGTQFTQLSKKEVEALAAEYEYQKDDSFILDEIRPNFIQRGYLTKGEFLRICEWKTNRSKSRVSKNLEDLIKEAIRITFSTKEEPLHIGVLTLLKGVEYPTASVFLHFLHEDPYPIIDYRAIESMDWKTPGNYTFDFWWTYVKACRTLADHYGVKMRILDRALWQFSKKKSSNET